ncbi:MAG: DUF1445 domain-containing protein [Acetobacteraceae bacterium]|nr:DUF1445 domain-containing protein [Acetobacteraceae bacterium]
MPATRQASHPGFVQGNLVVLPAADAADFLRFCVANPKPCPLLAVSEPGDPHLPALGADLDLRTDLPRYRVWRVGRARRRADRHPGALAGAISSPSSSAAPFPSRRRSMADGIPLKHIAMGRNVAMWRTSVAVHRRPGRFAGPLVVSMRPFRPADAIRAIAITSRFPAVARRARAHRPPAPDRHRRPLRRRTTATRCRSRTTNSPCSGPAASPRRR